MERTFVCESLISCFVFTTQQLFALPEAMKAKIAADCIVFMCVWFSVVEHICASYEMVVWFLI